MTSETSTKARSLARPLRILLFILVVGASVAVAASLIVLVVKERRLTLNLQSPEYMKRRDLRQEPPRWNMVAAVRTVVAGARSRTRTRTRTRTHGEEDGAVHVGRDDELDGFEEEGERQQPQQGQQGRMDGEASLDPSHSLMTDGAATREEAELRDFHTVAIKLKEAATRLRQAAPRRLRKRGGGGGGGGGGDGGIGGDGDGVGGDGDGGAGVGSRGIARTRTRRRPRRRPNR